MATTTSSGATPSGNPFDEFPINDPSPQHTRYNSVPADLFASFDPLLGEEAKQELFPNTSATTTKPKGTSQSDTGKNGHAPSTSLDASELRFIAAQLAQDKPTESEQAQQAADDHMLTLGVSPSMSTGTKKSHRRKHSRDIFQSKLTPILSKRAVSEGAAQSGNNTTAVGAGQIGAFGDDPSAADLKPNTLTKNRSITPPRKGVLKSNKMKSMMSIGSKNKNAGTSPKNTPSTHISPKNKHSASLAPHPPVASPRRFSATPSPTKMSAISSPPKRHSISSPGKTTRKTPTIEEKTSPNTSGSTDPALNIPELTLSEQHPGTITITGGVDGPITTDRSLRSSELDPSDFQVELPPAEEFLVHSRVCATLDSYPLVDQNFDFGTLAGMSRMSLEAFASRLPSMSMSLSPPALSLPPQLSSSSPDGSLPSSPPPLQVSFSSTSSQSTASPPPHPTWNRDGAQLVESHRPIVNTVLECADDIVVEGFFHEIGDDERDEKVVVGGDKSTHDRIEVAVFSSQKHRQFIVAYRGTTERQKKPIRNRQAKQAKETARRSNANNLHPNQPVTVFPPFRDAYFKKGLEEKVFDLLNELAENNPFCDIVFTGHSFGAALATIASLRYAIDHPMMRVSCHAFGSPKVGAQNFRDMVNSLPNLKVMRVEYGSDPWVFAPEGNNWVHVGQTIVLSSTAGPSTPGSVSERNANSHHSIRNLRLNKDGGSFGEKSDCVTAFAYKFDKGRKGGGGNGPGGLFKKKNNKTGRADQEIHSYVQAIEQYTHRGLTWVKGYVGEDVGTGVRGKGQEKRLVC